MIDWLNGVAFTLGGGPVSRAELFGFVTGALCVALTVRRSILNFPTGIANSALFLVLFSSASLWAAAGLQVLYIALGVIGWCQWRSGRTDSGTLAVRRLQPIGLAGCVVALGVGTGVLYMVLTAAEDAAPFLDALTTCLSLVAQWLLNTRRLETWYFWIAADCIFIPLYLSQGLLLTAGVYALFLVLCCFGLHEWSRARQPQLVESPR